MFSIMKSQTICPEVLELTENELFSVPTTLKNKILMAPGKWNDIHYTSEEIKKAYKNTDWSDKQISSVILDHADKPLGVRDWVGFVKNPRMIGDNLVGDLELYDEEIIIKLAKAKAKFGISPRVRGLENNGQFRNFTFENFSVVTNPAVKKAYINLSQNVNIKLEGGKMDKLLKETETEDEELEAEEETTEEMAKKKKYPYPEEEMAEEELLSIVSNSAWTDFVAKYRKKYPKASFKEIAAAFKKGSKEMEEMENLNDMELVAKLDQITSILRRRKQYPSEEESMESKMDKLNKELSDLKSRLNEPNSKSIQELSQSPSVEQQHHSNGVLAMAEFLQKNVGRGGQLF